MTPAEHYRRADELLALEMLKRDPTLPISRATVAQAAVHAALANYRGEPYDEAEFYYDDNTYRAPVIESRKTTGDRL